MSGYYCEGCDEVRPLFAAPRANGAAPVELGIPSLGAVPFDPELAAACDCGTTLADLPNTRPPRSRRSYAVATKMLALLEVVR